MTKEENTVLVSGNIWGWKFSFISLIIILLTLFAALLSDNQKNTIPRSNDLHLVDTLTPDSIE